MGKHTNAKQPVIFYSNGAGRLVNTPEINIECWNDSDLSECTVIPKSAVISFEYSDLCYSVNSQKKERYSHLI